MDKFIKILATQNPDMEVDCGNPNCKKKTKIKTIDFFSATNGTYELNCSYCGNKTTINNIDQEIEKLKKQFKSIGITW